MANVLRRTSVLTNAMDLIKTATASKQHVVAEQFFEAESVPPIVVEKFRIVRSAAVAVVRASHL